MQSDPDRQMVGEAGTPVAARVQLGRTTNEIIFRRAIHMTDRHSPSRQDQLLDTVFNHFISNTMPLFHLP